MPVMGNRRCGGRDSEPDSWEPRYGNNSRPWLLGFNKENLATPSTTTTKDTFTAYPPEGSGVEGARRLQLRRALWAHAEREVTEELNKPEEPYPVETHYNEVFIKEGFIPKPIKTDPEIHRQFPLYGDQAVSLWSELTGGRPGPRFRRRATFTTPVELSLEYSAELK